MIPTLKKKTNFLMAQWLAATFPHKFPPFCPLRTFSDRGQILTIRNKKRATLVNNQPTSTPTTVGCFSSLYGEHSVVI